MKVLFEDPSNGYICKRDVEDLTIKKFGLVFFSEGDCFVLPVSEHLTANDLKKLLLPCTTDLTQFKLVKYDSDQMWQMRERLIEDITSHWVSNPDRFIGSRRAYMKFKDPVFITSVNTQVSEEQGPLNYAKQLDGVYNCKEFSNIVYNSLWYVLTC